LNVSETFLSENGFQHLPCLQELRTLNLRNTNLKDEHVAHITCLQNITWLNLGKNKHLTDEGISQIFQKMTNLVAINLGGLKISNDTLENLAYLKKLNTLMISFCSQVTHEGFKYLNFVPSLKSLIVRTVMDDAGLQQITGCRSLELLTLGSCNITDKGVYYISQNFPNLSSLNIHHSFAVTDEGIGHLSQLTQLGMLYLGGCSKITDVGLSHIKKLIYLHSLNLGGCYLITDEGLRSLSKLRYLQTLDLWKCHNITSVGIHHLKDLRELHSLVLTDCSNIDDNAVETFLSLGKIRMLAINGCRNINASCLLPLQVANFTCKIILK